jgi:hypothetical protein
MIKFNNPEYQHQWAIIENHTYGKIYDKCGGDIAKLTLSFWIFFIIRYLIPATIKYKILSLKDFIWTVVKADDEFTQSKENLKNQ